MRKLACIALSLLCFGCCEPHRMPEIAASGCDVALRYAKDFTARAGIPVAIRNYFDTTYAAWPDNKQIDEASQERPDFIGDPEVEFMRKSFAFRNVSVVKSCIDFTKWHEKTSITHNNLEYDRLLKKASESWPSGVDAMPNAFLEVSAPVMSGDGKGIYFHVAEWGRVAGGRYAITYRKNADGVWILASKNGTGGVP